MGDDAVRRAPMMPDGLAALAMAGQSQPCPFGLPRVPLLFRTSARAGMRRASGSRQGRTVAFDADAQNLLAGSRPPVAFGEYLHFRETAIACLLDKAAYAWKVDDAIPHHSAVEQDVAGRHQPVADVICENFTHPPRARDLRFEIGVPPDVVGVDRYAHAVAQRFRKVDRLRERVHAGPIRGIHRMQRLDGKRYLACARMRKDRGQSLGHPLARLGQIARTCGQPAADEYQAFGAERGRLVDCAPILVGGVRRRKHAAAAVAAHAQTVVPDHAHRRVESELGHLIAPWVDRRDSVACAGLRRLPQVPLLPYGREIDRQLADAHHVIPCKASSLLMRVAASSGSCSTRALSARRNSSARCRIERALSCPPTMMKWSCRPLSHARNTTPVL